MQCLPITLPEQKNKLYVFLSGFDVKLSNIFAKNMYKQSHSSQVRDKQNHVILWLKITNSENVISCLHVWECNH